MYQELHDIPAVKYDRTCVSQLPSATDMYLSKRTSRSCSYLVLAVTFTLFVGCDSGGESNNCLTVTPDESYTLAGTAMTTSFAPNSKTYVVRNNCDTSVMLSVEEDVRWLDVEIDAFGTAESGVLTASASVEVRVEVRYGSDNPERLDQLSPGSYTAVLRFVGESDSGLVDRTVQLTVNNP